MKINLLCLFISHMLRLEGRCKPDFCRHKYCLFLQHLAKIYLLLHKVMEMLLFRDCKAYHNYLQ